MNSVALRLLSLTLLLLLMTGCGGVVTITPGPSGRKIPATQKPYTIKGKTYYPIPSARGYRERGIASWYGRKFHGRKTASGETYNMHAKTAAHKTLPMHTVLLVRNLENGRETVVKVNDRGPFIRGRIIDLSYTAALEIGLDQSGIARAEIIALGEATGATPRKAPVRLKYPDFFTGKYYIQVGSFLEQANAERLARQFMAAGTKAVIQPYVTSGYTYYRVQVYAGNSLRLAMTLEEELLKSGFSGAFLFAR